VPRAAGGASAQVIARVRAIEARALEDDADRVEQLAQTTIALGALGQRVVDEGLDDLKAVLALSARIGVRRHGSSCWHSQRLTAKYNDRPLLDSPCPGGGTKVLKPNIPRGVYLVSVRQ
jgi:16S rRNA C967 or C1407 C5-methylase (RsmB/RsmF family)